MSAVKKAITTIINGLSVLVITLAVLILVSVVMTKSGEVPKIMGYSFFRVMTGSMEPEYKVDSFIMVKETPPEDITVGDVISFYSSDETLGNMVNTHRVTAIDVNDGHYYFSTKGDANALEDKYLTEDTDLIGRVVCHSYAMGMAVKLMANPLVFFPAIIIPLLILVIMNVVSTVKTTKEIMKTEEEEAVRLAMEAIRRKNAEGASAQDISEADAAAVPDKEKEV